MERNSSSTFACASPFRIVHFERMMSCDTCITRDFEDLTPLNPSPVEALGIIQELERLSYAVYRLCMPPASLAEGCRTGKFVPKEIVWVLKL